jgi:heme/copper-type cytochrome/quinol oxidase subunit 4
MRPIHWVAIILIANILHLLMFLHLDLEKHPVAARVGIGIHIVAVIGPFWMLNDWFIKRRKGKWKAWTWLAFVPWGFLWYYFEKYRPSKARERMRA